MQIIFFGLGIILGALLTYLTAYMKKKGENFATREDLQDLVKQMSAVTEATKKIEAEISSGVWDRQKRWELKKEVLFEAHKKLTALRDGIGHLQATWTVSKGNPEILSKWRVKCNGMILEFTETKYFVDIICDKETAEAVESACVFAVDVYGELLERDASDALMAKLDAKLDALRVAIRKELRIEEPQPMREVKT